MRRINLEIFLRLWILAVLSTGCAGMTPVPVVQTDYPLPLPKATATLPTPPTAPAATPTATSLPELPHSLLFTPTPRPPSGWTLFSNPDFVRGIALQDGMLWAATLGGVVRWDLETQTPKLFTTRDGLVEIQGNDIAVCSMPETQILVAHEVGTLSAYNPALAKWSRIPITFDDGTTVNSVQTLFCDQANNRLLVGTHEGLGIFDIKSGRWRLIGPAKGLPAKMIYAIDVVGQTIWIAAGDQSAFMIMGNTIFPFNGSSGFPSGPVNDLSVASDRSIWFGYPTGLVHYLEKKWNSFGGQTSAGIPFISVDQVEVGPGKTIWIGSAEDGVCPFDSQKLTCATIYPAPRGSTITDLAVDENGVAYAGTDGDGVMVMFPEQRINLAFKNKQLISNQVLDIAESQDGNLWLATSRGVNIVDPNRPADIWQAIQPESPGLAFPRVSNLQPVTDGTWFFYDQEPQASFFDGENWQHLESLQGISGTVLDSTVDQRGYIWFATDQGIDIWDRITMRSYGPTTGLPGNQYKAVLDVNGEMWVGTDQGLLNYRRYQWQTPLPGISINDIIEDPEGGLLLGTEEGLVRYDGSQSYQWIINLGEEVLLNPVVTSLAWDLNHHLWVGTKEKGLFHYDGTRWEQFDTTRGMPTNHISKIFVDRLGAVWIAAVTGQDGGALMRYMP